MLIALKIFCTLRSTLVIPCEGIEVGCGSFCGFSLVNEEQKCSLNVSVTNLGSSYIC